MRKLFGMLALRPCDCTPVMLLFCLFIAVIAAYPRSSFGGVATRVAVIDVEHSVGGLAFSPNGNYLAIDSQEVGGSWVWDFATKKVVAHLQDGGVGTWVTDVVHFSPDGHQLAICMNYLHVYDAGRWELNSHFLPMSSYAATNTKTQKPCGDGIAFSPDGKSLAAVVGDQMIFYDTATWEITRNIRTTVNHGGLQFGSEAVRVQLEGPSNELFYDFISSGGTLAFTHDGRFLAAGGWSPGDSASRRQGEMLPPTVSKTILVDVAGGKVTREFVGAVDALDTSGDDRFIAIGGDPQYAIKVLRKENGEVVASEAGGPAHVLLRYTPDRRYLIEKIGKTVEVWDGDHQHLLQKIHAEPSCIAVSLDGRYFAIGGASVSILDATALLSLITHPNGSSGKVFVYRLD
jgi:WD40 repeat protein